MEDYYGVHYVALMVVLHTDINQFGFISRRIHSDALPENNTHDILHIVSTCNSNNNDENMLYVDMYGYEHDGIEQIWENE